MSVSRTKTVAANGLHTLAMTVLTVNAVVALLLLTTAAFDLSPLHQQQDTDRYGVSLSVD